MISIDLESSTKGGPNGAKSAASIASAYAATAHNESDEGIFEASSEPVAVSDADIDAAFESFAPTADATAGSSAAARL